MPQRKCAAKALRSDKKRRLRNIKVKTDIRKSIKKFRGLLAAKNTQEAKSALKELSSKLDSAASKNILNKNTASRQKSRLAIGLNKINAQ